jgi:hypothetical protein
VKTEAGDDVGWFDQRTEAVVLQMEELHPDFERALAEYGVELAAAPRPCALESQGSTVPVVAPGTGPLEVPELDSSAIATCPLAATTSETQRCDWTDLANNLPGQGVRAKADEAWARDPIGILKDERSGIYTEERSWRIGADGEEKVGRVLATLPLVWRVIHSIPVRSDGADIDHLVLGPGGIFTINTKVRPNANVYVAGERVLVGGTESHFDRTARDEAQRSARVLSERTGTTVVVDGIVAVVGASGGVNVKEQPTGGDVSVVDSDQLPAWLLGRDPILAPVQIEAIFEYARRSTIWL